MNVASILTEKGSNVVTAKPSESLLEISKVLRQHGIGSVVLSNGDGDIAGIVSERDLVRAIAEFGPDILKSPTSEYMTRKVITCRKSDTIESIMAAMTDGRFRHMPVVEDDKLIGVISIGDVVRHRIAEAEMEASAMRSYIATG